MRKIGSEQDIERRRIRNVRIGGIIMLLLLVLSSVGYAFITQVESGGSGANTSQNGVQYSGNTINYNGQQITLLNQIDDLKNINVNINFDLNNYYQKPLYIDSLNPGIVSEISSTLGVYTLRAQQACYGKCDRNLPEKDCSENMIIWKESNESKITQNQNCVFIEGNMVTVDAFLYKIFKA